MPLHSPINLRTPLQQVQARYPSTWAILCRRLLPADAWQVLVQEYLDPDGQPLSAGQAASIAGPEEALRLWVRACCTLGELLRVLTEHGLNEAAAFLHANLRNDRNWRPPQQPVQQPLQQPPQQPLQQLAPPPTSQPPPPPSPQHIEQFPAEQINRAIASGGRRIGGGGFADVFLVRLPAGEGVNVNDRRHLAVKVYGRYIDAAISDAVLRSVGTLSRLQHPCIARLVGFACLETGGVHTIFDYYPNGDLRRLLDCFVEQSADNFPAESGFHLGGTRLRMAVELASAVEFLHSASEFSTAGDGSLQKFHFVHKDVKPSNVLLGNDWRCRLADLDFLDLTTAGFGETLIGERRLQRVERVHTLGYCPEDAVVTCKWDVFSAGVSLLELFTGRRGYPAGPEEPRESWLCRALDAGRPTPPTQAGLQMPDWLYGRVCSEVIAPCLAADYRSRCTAAELRRRLEALLAMSEEAVEAAVEGAPTATAAAAASSCCLEEFDWTRLDEALRQAGSEPIGAGGFGRVYRVRLPDGGGGDGGGREVAVKLYTGQADSDRRDLLLEALQRQARLRHLHVLRLLGYAIDYGAHPTAATDAGLRVVYELCERGSLRRLLNDFADGVADPAGDFQLAGVRIRMAYELASALAYLHSQEEWAPAVGSVDAEQQQRRLLQYRLLHQDVKCSNVLLTRDWHCKLGDLDCLQAATPGTGETHAQDRPLARPFTRYATPGYRAPNEPTWSCKVDIYALGVTLLELFTGQDPSLVELRFSLDGLSDDGPAGSSSQPPPPPQSGLQIGERCYRDLSVSVFRPCLALQPAQRPSAYGVLASLDRFYNCCRVAF